MLPATASPRLHDVLAAHPHYCQFLARLKCQAQHEDEALWPRHLVTACFEVWSDKAASPSSREVC